MRKKAKLVTKLWLQMKKHILRGQDQLQMISSSMMVWVILILLYQSMHLLGRSQLVHHFRILCPIPVDKVQNCLKQIQNLNRSNTSAICISLSGHAESPESSHLLHESLLSVRERSRLSLYTFIEDKATALTYYIASSGEKVFANPWAIIGDVGTTQKSYRNVRRLLALAGIKYEELGNQSGGQMWHQFAEKSEKEEQVAQKWLSVVQERMIKQVSHRRKLTTQTVSSIGQKLFHAQDALKLGLVDGLSTFEEFKATTFPNHRVEDFVYRVQGTRVGQTINQRELTAISTLLDVISMPRVALLSSQDPIQGCLREITGLIESRLQQPDGLEKLDAILENVFSKLDSEVAFEQTF